LQIIHIGPERAQQLFQLRPFRSVSSMVRIDGIGPARLRDIIDQGVACT
jgi:competence protein ComEC